MKDVKELKAEAYDLIAVIESAKARLNQVNQDILEASKLKEEKAPE